MAGRSPSFSIKVDTRGVPNIQAHLERLRRGVADMTPVMEEIGKRLQGRMRDSIVSGKTASGRRAPRPADGRALYDTGALANSIRYVASRRKVTIGSGLPYAYFTQYGSIHNRPGLWLATSKGNVTARDKKTVRAIVQEHLAQLTAEADAASQSRSVIHNAVAGWFKK